MKNKDASNLSRRERQIMDIIYKRQGATAAEVLEDLPDGPSYSTVRALLRILEEKGYLKHENQGVKYVYYPLISQKKAEKSALSNLLSTFFNNSVEKAVAALLEYDKESLTDKKLDKLTEMINKAREEERKDE